MERPQIERMRAAWEGADRVAFRPEIALCDYAIALEAERAELESKYKRLRDAFIVAVGDKSPFAKQALKEG